MPKIEVPEKLLCPITHELFKEPVIAEDGHTYEKEAIKRWVNKHGNSPKTRQKIGSTLIINWDKKSQLAKFLEKNKICTIEKFVAAILDGGITELEKLNYLDSYLDDASCGFTPLHLATMEGYSEVAKLLLDQKVNIEAKDNDGCTSLHLAVLRGHSKMAKLLLAHKADAKARENDGRTSLHLAAFGGHSEIAKLLLAHEANIEAKDNDGCTSLHLAVMAGHSEMVKLLLENGANDKALSDNGLTPINIAQAGNHFEVVQLITEYTNKLKYEVKQTPKKVALLEKIIEQQQQRIDQLENQLIDIQKILSQLDLSRSINLNTNKDWRSPPSNNYDVLRDRRREEEAQSEIEITQQNNNNNFWSKLFRPN